MKIAVVSDTHSMDLPKKAMEEISKADLILHAGDLCSLKDLECFTKIKETKAVYGNMDDAGVRKKIPETLVFEVEGVKIGMYHGDGAPKGIIDRIKAKLPKEKMDVVVFGHTHNPTSEKIGDTLFFNPGSLTDIVRAPYRSFGWIEASKGKFTTKIVKVTD